MARPETTKRGAAYRGIASLASGLLVASLAGCVGTGPEIFDRMPPSRAAATDWPHLADTPTPPPAGVYTEAAPDPARGEAVRVDLAIAAEAAERKRQKVSGPVR